MPESKSLWRRIIGPSRRELGQQIAQLQTANDKLLQRAYRQSASSGVEMTMGQYDYEFNEALRGSARWDTYDKMQTDPHIKASLRATVLPLVLGTWEYVPGSDAAKDIEAAELCNANLLCQPTDTYGEEFYSETPWEQRLIEILDMLASGYAMFVISAKEVGGKLVYDRLQWLEPSTVDPRGWQLDEQDRIKQILRTYKQPSGRYVYKDPIDVDRVALYVWDFKGARFEGHSFMRSMYGAWFRKEYALRMSTIGVQKFADPMPVVSYPRDFSDTDGLVDRVEEAGKLSRGTAPARSFAYFPKGKDGDKVEIDYPAAVVERVDRLRGVIDGENAEIAHAGSTKSQLLGETESGSRALGESIKGEEIPLRRAVATVVCGYENRGIAHLDGLAPRLVRTNLAGVKRMPMLVCRDIDPDEGLEKFDARVAAWKAGIIPKHEDARRQLCEPLGIELPDDAYEVQEPPPFVPGQQPNPFDDDDDDQAEMVVKLESADEFRKRIAPLLEPTKEGRPKAGGFRYPNRLEAEYVNLAAVGESFRVGEQDIRTTLRSIGRDMKAELMGRLKAGKINTRNLESQRRSKFRKAAKSKETLLKDIERVGRQGMAHVKEELRRQGVKP